jgi:hypothetical protein
MEKKPIRSEGQNEGGEQYSMEQFRGEIAELAARESNNGNFFKPNTYERNPNFDVSHLTEDDRAIWEKIKSGAITREEFNAYADGVVALDEGNPATESRVIFSKVASNKATVVIARQALEKRAS